MSQTHHARYGPSDRYERPPPAGMCISVFALLRQGSKVLVGKAAPHARWPGDWIPQFKVYPKEDLDEAWETLRLPGAYLREGEDPARALGRIMHEQLRIKRFQVGAPQVSSWVGPSSWYPGHQHWDLVLTYPVKAKLPARKPAWWSELGWQDARALRPKDFEYSADYVKSLGVALRKG